MKTKYFISIAAAMLFTLESLATHAQDVYEYATVITRRLSNTTIISTSYSNGEFKEENLDENPDQISNNSTALKQFALMSKDGWEVVGLATIGMDNNVTKYLLKRKVK